METFTKEEMRLAKNLSTAGKPQPTNYQIHHRPANFGEMGDHLTLDGGLRATGCAREVRTST
jgi:hypothetical protein